MTNRALSSSKFKSGLDNGHSIFYSNNDHLTPTAMKVVCTEGVCSSWELTQPIVAKILLESEHQCLCQKGWILVFTEPSVTPTSASQTGSPTHLPTFKSGGNPNKCISDTHQHWIVQNADTMTLEWSLKSPHVLHQQIPTRFKCRYRYNDHWKMTLKCSSPWEWTSPAEPCSHHRSRCR